MGLAGFLFFTTIN